MEEKKVRVKAEEYLKGLVTTNGCGELDEDVDVIEEVIALKAVEMARREEREKAIEAYRKLHCNMGNLACEFCSIVCKINMFEKLLNK